MAGKRPLTLAEEIVSSIAQRLAWRERLPQDVVAELDDVRGRFRAGQLGDKPYLVAGRIVQFGKDRGWDLPSEKVLATWLKAAD